MKSIRNIAIIAHVDHGKTTLVDKIIQFCSADNKDTSNSLDNNELERERGITIVSKNISTEYKGVKINIIDTPGHSDFGGEVERILNMADGVLLLVDAFEGPMPQTRFLLSKAIELALKLIVVINKVDKENCTPDIVHDQVLELMFNLEANEQQLDFPVIYGSSKEGWMSLDYKKPTKDLSVLLDIIIEKIPEAPFIKGAPQMQITSLDFSSFKGRIAIGRVYRGVLETGKDYSLYQANEIIKKIRIKELYIFEGLGKSEVKYVNCGDLCAVVGIDGFEIGDTIADLESPEQIPRISIDEPTMSMLFTINNSPFFGREGKFITSRHLRDRLMKEKEINLALRVEDTNNEDKFHVFGRGTLHLSILIETMRREGYELQVGRPQVTIKEIDGVKYEPYEVLVIEVPSNYSGKCIELVTQRKGELKIMQSKGELQHLEFDIPTRGLIGLRSLILTSSSGEAVMNHRFSYYDKIADGIPHRMKGSLISSEQGQVLIYSLDRLRMSGKFFVEPGEQIYKGQVIGEHTRENDLELNLIKGKKLSNMRSSGADEAIKITPKIKFSLEEAMDYISDDELLEITPKNLRMRKI